ncbi:MAG: glycosyltransferase, partial [Verrucomicrobia bacterium]|nr:glycosyltransferase [Verrucomicrobiota bacterium]
MSAFAPSLLLLIPAYNEENRIGPVLEDYADYFGRHYAGKFRLVVVLNGCRDNTLGVVQQAEKRHPCIAHSEFPGAIGKGGALIEGLKLAPLADLIGYVDADGATPPKAFHDLVRSLETPSVACAIASRWIPGAIVHHFQPENRRFASRL